MQTKQELIDEHEKGVSALIESKKHLQRFINTAAGHLQDHEANNAAIRLLGTVELAIMTHNYQIDQITEAD